MAGIYIHIPFCKQACHYCNFHFSTNISRTNEMITAILREIELKKDFYLDKEIINSIYFGGGTPSLLGENALMDLMNTIRKYFKVSENAEVTLEANPDDLNRAMCNMLARVGINRLSIGIQSFHDDELRLMNRVHNSKMAIASVRSAQEVGIRNITIDLIFGVQGSSEKSWRQNLEQAVKLNVPHMSCYNLTVEPKTALAHFVKTGKIKPIDEELSANQFAITMDVLEGVGYDHYEISNYARDELISQHNSNYWKGVSYLGVGPSAHSYDGQKRYWNIANNAIYIKSLEQETLPVTEEVLSTTDQFNEYILTRLRTKWGVDLGQLETISVPDFDWQYRIQSFKDKGWLKSESGKIYLTQEGKYFADFISSELFL